MKKILLLATLTFGLQANAFTLSIETDPLFFAGSKNFNNLYDLNVDLKFERLQSYRFGFFAWSGELNSQLSDFLLPNSLANQAKALTWKGYGLEIQYLQNPNSKGSFLYGIRFQKNSYKIANMTQEIQYDHHVVTPQIGYQYFFSSQSEGFYLLPWVGAQIPFAGDDKVNDFTGSQTDSRKILPIFTVHIGYNF
jgi:hypothetical protein